MENFPFSFHLFIIILIIRGESVVVEMDDTRSFVKVTKYVVVQTVFTAHP